MIAVAAAVAVAGMLLLVQTLRVPEARPQMTQAIPFAVLGNSDSHAYHDSVSFPPGSSERGGSNRPVTLQWTEILHRLRPTELDQGPWTTVGRSGRAARVAGWIGVHVRTPRKQDFAYNFAVSGARCEHLGGARGQTAALVHTMRAEPGRWARGVVVIRIGINDIGTTEVLADVAASGMTAEAQRLVSACGEAIDAAVRAIHAVDPRTQIVLVGIDDNANWPPNHAQFRTAAAMTALTALHDAFDGELQRIAAQDALVRFHDERAWFRALWGGRDSTGVPAYRTVPVGGLDVGMSQGDDLRHAVIADGHAGTITNALWARGLTTFLHDVCRVNVKPLSMDEVHAFVRGLRPA